MGSITTIIPTFSKTQITVLPPKEKYPNCQLNRHMPIRNKNTMKKIGKVVTYFNWPDPKPRLPS